ncbi:GlxA family transcriptional regulator [Ornithinimicrobium faecis]|uniref:GlxA family transcriptional regulator n=1 Tax=Ornithinimicrobium faecis TaxID=2934158 RepID=UPI00211737DD|nr:helix-turn-helix domain-containing protein [Ornithinimicrobium sp. HY1745]
MSGHRRPHRVPHRVVVLCIEPLVGFDMTLVPQVLEAARDRQGERYYEVRVASLDGGPVRTHKGYAVVPDHGPETLPWAQTVVIPGMKHPVIRGEGRTTPELEAAWALLAPGTRKVSVCTGAFALGALGVLDGLRATTHWEHAEEFRALFPQVDLDPDVLFVDEGDVLTSAGLGAGIDLCLHLIRADFGVEAANNAARGCVVPPWREGGQAQFIEHPVPPRPEQSTAATRAWASANLRTVTRVEDLVTHARMSERTLSRRFRAETGLSPQQWLLQARLQRALELLERTDLPVDRVAEEAGFGTAAALRHRMRQGLATTPQAYRLTFAGPAAGPRKGAVAGPRAAAVTGRREGAVAGPRAGATAGARKEAAAVHPGT